MTKAKQTDTARKPPRVAVLVDTSTEWGRSLIEGVTNYAQQHGPWHLQVEPRGRDNTFRLPSNWEGEGIVARVASEEIAGDLGSRTAEVVNVSGIELDGVDFPRVTTDYEAVAKLAIEHFRSRGFARFAYLGPLQVSYVKRHAEAFQARVDAFNATLKTFDYPVDTNASERQLRDRDRMGDWLLNLEFPIGIFCWGTLASCHVLEVCRTRGINVPDDVAVLSGENDELIARTTLPPMSSILTPAQQIGFRAARRLDRLMSGGEDDRQVEKIAPIEIVTRESTDVLAIEDPELSSAVRYLREHVFCDDLTVEAIADSVPMLRRSLERKFSSWLNRSPLAEIRRLRVARVKELLATTNLPMPRVAAASGFGSAAYMSTVFKKETRYSPLKYRAMTRAR